MGFVNLRVARQECLPREPGARTRRAPRNQDPMYCKHCGELIADNAVVCPACGKHLEEGMAFGRPAATFGRDVASYEYTRTSVANDLATAATDCYESMGWELTASARSVAQPTTELAFRRSRKVQGKAQLLKLQHRADDLLKHLATLESSKTRKATTAALVLGIPAALVLGGGMSLCMVAGGSLMVPGILVGILGIAGCVAAWPLYRSTYAKEQAAVAPQIEAAYDSLASVCEEGQALLRGQA